MRLKNCILIALCAVATAAMAHKPADTVKHDLNIVFIGNSITHGAGLPGVTADAPPVEVCNYLRKLPRVGVVDFSNQGYSGHTTVSFLPATALDFPKVQAATQAFTNKNAQLVFSIVLGTNDSAIHGPRGAPVSKEDYAANLTTICQELLKEFPGCKIVIQQPIWYSPNTYNGSMYLQEGLTRLQTYFPKIKQVVAAFAKTTPGQVFVGDTGAFKFFKGHASQYYQHENGHQGVFYLHPNKEGAVILGDYWARAIYKDLFKKK